MPKGAERSATHNHPVYLCLCALCTVCDNTILMVGSVSDHFIEQFGHFTVHPLSAVQFADNGCAYIQPAAMSNGTS